tara:strand:+ start:49 stop:513 length:465 start_codon:yes stop_codon:yes gene_type:complete
MLKIMPALEAYAIANIATQNLVGGSPVQFLLGDLNASAGTGQFGALMGPQPGVLTLKEMMTGSYNYSYGQGPNQIASPTASSGETWSNMGTGSTAFGSPLDIVASNFQHNIGNIVVGTALTTAGFRIANKVLRKPKTKMNKLLRDVGLGTTVQL